MVPRLYVGILPRALSAASRVQCIDRGRRHAGGPCCEDTLVSRSMVNLLTRFFVLTSILTAAALTQGVSGQATAPSQAARPTASHSPHRSRPVTGYGKR